MRLERLCHRLGTPFTIQRRIVFEAIAQRNDHPTADQVHEAARRRIPNISRMTVYRVLEWLVEIGVITKVGHPGSAVRFEPNTERHHHLVCLRCNKLLDLEGYDADDLDIPEPIDAAFQVVDYSILFKGICSACARSVGKAPDRKMTVK